jgi:hypothetical protein
LTPIADPKGPVPISAAAIQTLDLRPLDGWASLEPASRLQAGPQLELQIDWPRADDDPRELSEIPEVRLWSIRADARYPWLPLVDSVSLRKPSNCGSPTVFTFSTTGPVATG